MTTKRPETEHEIQRQAVQWIRQNTPFLVYAIPNAGNRRNGMRLVAEGMVAGMPDLHIPALALWIEMKTPTGKVSPVQDAIHARLAAEGQHVHVCRSVDEVVQAVAAELHRSGMTPSPQPIKKVQR
jgi:hypothetical protein